MCVIFHTHRPLPIDWKIPSQTISDHTWRLPSNCIHIHQINGNIKCRFPSLTLNIKRPFSKPLENVFKDTFCSVSYVLLRFLFLFSFWFYFSFCLCFAILLLLYDLQMFQHAFVFMFPSDSSSVSLLFFKHFCMLNMCFHVDSFRLRGGWNTLLEVGWKMKVLLSIPPHKIHLTKKIQPKPSTFPRIALFLLFELAVVLGNI